MKAPAWVAAVDKIEPFEWMEGEEQEYERYRERVRQVNIEAVRKQMEEMDRGVRPFERTYLMDTGIAQDTKRDVGR